LHKKEEELFNNEQVLPDEDKAYKDELFSKGFDWTKDYKAFLTALEQYNDDLEQIEESLSRKSDVREYYNVLM
jgi:hypothetical protein